MISNKVTEKSMVSEGSGFGCHIQNLKIILSWTGDTWLKTKSIVKVTLFGGWLGHRIFCY